MNDEYEHTCQTTVRIFAADDTRDKFYSTRINIHSTYPITGGRSRWTDEYNLTSYSTHGEDDG